jgi:pimeloyl-ACP methyl ester carboxylesterase
MSYAPALAPALPGERREFPSPAGRLSYYADGPAGAAPLLLIHSVNAAGSAYEMRPLYEHYRASRRVYALDLPGFGFSERSDRSYTPRLMTDAVAAMIEQIVREEGRSPIDAMALSLASEFLARCAMERPEGLRSLALISPTGFGKRWTQAGPPGSHRGMPLLYGLLRVPLWSRGLFDLLTSRAGVRYFLERTWGSRQIDEGMFEYDWLTARAPGAHFAPYYFVSGFLFSRDIPSVYDALQLPVWVAHGVRGDFVDYSGTARLADRPNWRVEVFQTGALPHFEQSAALISAYEAFSARVLRG